MTTVNVCIISALTAIFITLSLVVFVWMHVLVRAKKAAIAQEPLVQQDVRDMSHSLTNETAKFKAALQKLEKTDNPIDAFVKAIHSIANGERR